MRKFYVLSLMAATALSVSAQAPLSMKLEKQACPAVKQYASVFAPSRISSKAPTASFQVLAYEGDGMYRCGLLSGTGFYSVAMDLYSGGNLSYLGAAHTAGEERPTFTWTITGTSGSTMELPTDENGSALVNLFGMYNFPVLKGTLASGEYATYDRTADTSNNADASILATMFARDYPVSMGDAGYAGGQLYSGFTSGEKFGTGMTSAEGKELTGVFTMFNKTTAPMRVYGVVVPVVRATDGQDPIPSGVSLDVEIWSVNDEGQFVDKLGSASGDATNLNGDASRGMWTFDVTFQAEDEFGLVSDKPVEIPAGTRFAVLVSNLDKANAAVMFVAGNGVEGSAYLLYGGDTVETLGYSNQPDTPAYDMLISLDADMPSAMWQDQTMTIPSAGGKAASPDGYEYGVLYTTTLAYDENSGELVYSVVTPDWVTATQPVVIEDAQGGWETYRAYAVEFSADALPAGETGRQGVVTVTCPGGVQKSFEIGQGDWTPSSVETVETADASVAVAGDNFQLTYGDEYTSVEVYNVAGAKVASYALPQGGSFEVPAADFSGVYMVVFQGAKNTTVKVVK